MCKYDFFFLLFYLIVKQWLLARKFSECEYSHSPKWLFSEICGTRQTRRHSPSRFARTRQTRRNSPKAIFEKNVTRLAKFARVIRKTRANFTSSHCLKVHFVKQYILQISSSFWIEVNKKEVKKRTSACDLKIRTFKSIFDEVLYSATISQLSK